MVIRFQEYLKPQEDTIEAERIKVESLRGETPLVVGNLEEIIDDNHMIVSTTYGGDNYVHILSFVDKNQLQPGCSVLLKTTPRDNWISFTPADFDNNVCT